MKWDESKHPRDKYGKFATARYNDMSIDELKREAMVEIDLDFFSRKKKEYDSTQVVIPDMPKELSGFLDNRKSTAHHENHAKEMGYKNQTAYLKGAINFWNNAEGAFYFSPADNKFYKYNQKPTNLWL